MDNFVLRLLSNMPAPRYVSEYAEAEATILRIATLIPAPYERVQAACREVAAHYPLPSEEALERLYVALVTNQSTEIAQDFWHEYNKEQSSE